jgi:hypothetical protein
LAGGLDVTMSGRLADLDMALSLKAVGYHTVFEPASRVYGSPAPHPAVSAFAAGRCAERLFWRHARSQGWVKSLVLHPFAVAARFLADLPRLAAWTGLLGRVAAWLEVAGSRSRYRRLQEAMRRAAAGSSAARTAGRKARSAASPSGVGRQAA